MEFLKIEKQMIYFKVYYQCDLILKDGENYKPIQISYSIDNSKTKERDERYYRSLQIS